MAKKNLHRSFLIAIFVLLNLLISVSVSMSGEYVIITRPLFVDALAPLTNAKTQAGLSVYLTTLEDIMSSYTGADAQEKIRNCIIDRYTNYNAKWVLLVGKPDADDNPGTGATLNPTQIDKPWEIPIRYVYSPTPDYTFAPAESYYSNLDGNWDDDGDGKYGEIAADSTSGVDEVDWVPEVAIGRIPATTSQQVSDYISKLLRNDLSNLELQGLNTLAINCDLGLVVDSPPTSLFLSEAPGYDPPTGARIDQELNTGTYPILSFCGHGTEQSITAQDGSWRWTGESLGYDTIEQLKHQYAFYVSNSYWRGQSFIATAQNIAEVELYSGGKTDATLVVSIREDLYGPDLVSKSIPNGQGISGWNHILFDIPVNVTPGNTYYLVSKLTDITLPQDRWDVMRSTADEYSEGSAYTSTNQGASWQPEPGGVDMAFAIKSVKDVDPGFFTYVAACLTSYLDESNSTPTITERLLLDPDVGAIGYVGSWRLSSEYGQNDLWTEFWRTFFNRGITRVGETLNEGRRNYYFSFSLYHRWEYPNYRFDHLIFSLFGDPHNRIGNLPNGPRIVSTPNGFARIGYPYKYGLSNQAQAVGTGNITWEKVSGPEGFSISSDGRISWIPEVSVGRYWIEIKATDDTGASYQRWYVYSEYINHLEITSTPNTQAMVGQPYVYDEDSQANANFSNVSWKLLTGPVGFSIDRVTGLMTWVPAQVGDYEVIIAAYYSQFDISFQRFVITVNAAQPCTAPAITVQPQNQTIPSGQTSTLSVSTSGTAPLNYQWYKGVSGDISCPIPGATLDTYQTEVLTQTTSYWVRVANPCGVQVSGTATITPVTVPSVPALVLPANNATGVVVNPTLSWNASSGADSYRLQVSTTNTFTTTVFDQGEISGTSQPIPGLENNTIYYWRVNATNVAGTSAWSSVWGFTTIVATPSAPTLALPANNATGVPINPTLSWDASSGATSYRLQVSTDSGFSTMVVNQGGIAGTSRAVSGLLNNTVYYWRVNATNAGGTSGWSDVWSFTTIVAAPSSPTLALPSNNATGIEINPTLSWNGSSGADSYRLQVSRFITFGTTVFDQAGITATSQPISGLLNNAVYYWRVNANNAGGTSAWSSVWSFTTILAAPPLSFPANNATGVSTSVTFVWGVPAGGVDSYRLQVSTSNTFTTTVFDQGGITTTSRSVSGLLNNTVYYWRVNATNAGGTSAWSSVWSFTTILAFPSVPTLILPTNNATGVAINPTLSWNASSDADSYRLQVSTSNTFTTTVFDQGGITATSQQVSGLLNNTVYYWRVNATNARGTSGWSSVWNFTTAGQTLNAPTLSAPSNGATGRPISLNLQWGDTNTSPQEQGYRIRIKPLGGSYTNYNAAQNATSYPVTNLLPSTTYYWNVQAIGNGTSTLDSIWSNSEVDWSFTTIDQVGPLLSLTSHTNGQHVTTSSITLIGAASDSGKGDNGIQKVTVNGIRADNDTASGAGTANWSKAVMLNPGANLITIIAYDDSSNHNTTTQDITIYRNGISDFDGDGKSDIGVWRPSEGNWYILGSQDGFRGQQWGTSGDVPVPGDYDGDGKTDIAVWRPSEGTWYILGSRDGFMARQWGTSGDIPVSGDYDGDGKTDIGVWRPSEGTWYILGSRDGFMARQWGTSGDVPIPGDFDGDGKTDIAVWRPSEGIWYILGSQNGFMARQWGTSGDMPVPGDFDGDGKTDCAVWRPGDGYWYILGSKDGFIQRQWGAGWFNDEPISQ